MVRAKKNKVAKTKLKRNDEVIVTTGKSKGHVGKIISIDREKLVVYVQGANIQKKHKKPTSQDPQSGGIIEQEGPIHYSNVMAYNQETQKGERITIITDDSGKKIRQFAKTKTNMEA